MQKKRKCDEEMLFFADGEGWKMKDEQQQQQKKRLVTSTRFKSIKSWRRRREKPSQEA